MTSALALLDAALRGGLITLALLLAGWLRDSPGPTPRSARWLLLGLAVQALGGTPLLERSLPLPWQAPLIAIALGNALLAWLFVRCLLQDGFRPGRRHLALWLGVAAVGAAHGLRSWLGLESGWPEAALTLALRALPPLLALAIAWQLLRGWRGDLVEARRDVRALWLCGGLGYGLLQGLGRWLGGGPLAPWAALIDPAALLLLLAWVARRVWRAAPRRLDLAAPVPAPAKVPAESAESAEPAEPSAAAALDALDAELLARLNAAMQGAQAAYRDEDLSVASLARRLATPEYRLRRAILQGLGHRNFSAYVNGLRLAEVKTALADPARAQRAVLDLALDAGFGSVGPFNRAFKADTGLTPTEFRARALADSSNRPAESSQVLDS